MPPRDPSKTVPRVQPLDSIRRREHESALRTRRPPIRTPEGRVPGGGGIGRRHAEAEPAVFLSPGAIAEMGSIAAARVPPGRDTSRRPEPKATSAPGAGPRARGMGSTIRGITARSFFGRIREQGSEVRQPPDVHGAKRAGLASRGGMPRRRGCSPLERSPIARGSADANDTPSPRELDRAPPLYSTLPRISPEQPTPRACKGPQPAFSLWR